MHAPSREQLRQEMIGAFVHEMRTPLTSMRMVLEIARRASPGPELTLDEELRGLLEQALGDLQGLADGLQEGSWLERGKLNARPMACSLDGLLDDVTNALGEGVMVVRDGQAADVEGVWDRARLSKALRGFFQAVYRCGSGEGSVHFTTTATDGRCVVRLESGAAGGAEKAVNSDLGYGFFYGYWVVAALGGEVSVERAERYCAIEMGLPLRG